jgi:hypothetical protein
MIELDLDLAAQDCGLKISHETLSEIGDRVEPAGKGKLIVPKFIKFQVGEPSESCKAHTKIIQAIEELELFKDSLGYHYPINSLSIDYPMTINSHKEKEEDKDKEEEEDKEEEGKKSKSSKFSKAKPDSMETVIAFAAELKLPRSDGEYLWYHWESNGYTNGNSKIKDWKMTVRKWVAGGFLPSQKHNGFRLDPVPAPSKPKRLPANWREIAEALWGHPVECNEEDLTPDQWGDVYRNSKP